MESLIDERYRLLLLEHYFENTLESRHYDGHSKWQITCPFCSHTGKTDAKKKHRKAALLWNSKQHSWIFFCAKKGCSVHERENLQQPHQCPQPCPWRGIQA